MKEINVEIEGTPYPILINDGLRLQVGDLLLDRLGREGIIGFISPVSQPFCSGCRRLRLTSDGCLISCLASPKSSSVREVLRSGSPRLDEELAALIRAGMLPRADVAPSGRSARWSG